MARKVLPTVALGIAIVAVTHGEIVVSNIGTHFPSASPSTYEPEELSVDDKRPCVAQLFALPDNATSFWLTKVVLSLNSGTGAVKTILTL